MGYDYDQTFTGSKKTIHLSIGFYKAHVNSIADIDALVRVATLPRAVANQLIIMAYC